MTVVKNLLLDSLIYRKIEELTQYLQHFGHDLDTALVFAGQHDGLKIPIDGLQQHLHVPPSIVFGNRFLALIALDRETLACFRIGCVAQKNDNCPALACPFDR